MWLRKTAQSFARIVTSAAKIFNILGITILVMLTALTCADVIGRYLFKKPILGTTEITEYMMVCIVFLAIAWCAVKNKQIVVDILLMNLKPGPKTVLNICTHFIGLGVMVIITWRNFLETLATQNSPRASAILSIKAFPFYWVMTAGLALLCLVMLVQLVQNITKMVKK
jgi:TRAP-type transport system small permease protein